MVRDEFSLKVNERLVASPAIYLRPKLGTMATLALLDLQHLSTERLTDLPAGCEPPSGALLLDQAAASAPYVRTLRSLVRMGVAVCAAEKEMINDLVADPHTIVIDARMQTEAISVGPQGTDVFRAQLDVRPPEPRPAYSPLTV